MKFQCDTAQLNQAIMNVSLAVAPKSNIPALEGILLKAELGQIQLVGYNMDLGITATLDAKVESQGDVIVPAKLFSDIVRKMDGDLVTFSSDDSFQVELEGGAARFHLLGSDPVEFPDLPTVSDAERVSIPANKLRSMVSQTLFAISSSDAKPIHTGALFDIKNGTVTVVSVDGFRLALRREPVEAGKNMKFVVPGRTLSELLKLIPDEEKPIDLQVSRKHILVTVGGCCIVSRLLEGEFLDYTSAIQGENQFVSTVSTRAMISSIERTSLLISDRLKSPLRVSFRPDRIALSCATTIGKAYDECPSGLAEGSLDEPVDMGFNNRYLMDALKNTDSDMVKLEVSGPLRPMRIIPMDGDSFLFLVLPMRIKAD